MKYFMEYMPNNTMKMIIAEIMTPAFPECEEPSGQSTSLPHGMPATFPTLQKSPAAQIEMVAGVSQKYDSQQYEGDKVLAGQ
jgi:hypothetical protein